ncbi:hypothetical protein A8144_10545 [Mycobacterium leprae 3125609]|nr:hypothetical protein A8144_10545 [Mycobacterium leprae 3125609]OAX70749.1 hypothetical protein A3216_10100 [Mycobacterium leprae 7935681]
MLLLNWITMWSPFLVWCPRRSTQALADTEERLLAGVGQQPTFDIAGVSFSLVTTWSVFEPRLVP